MLADMYNVAKVLKIMILSDKKSCQLVYIIVVKMIELIRSQFGDSYCSTAVVVSEV